jgi:tRNA (guanine6-N2)-methyltransferase
MLLVQASLSRRGAVVQPDVAAGQDEDRGGDQGEGGAAMVTVIARSVRGLEWVAADEVSEIPAAAARLALPGREIVFELAELTPRVLGLRTVDDAFLEIGKVEGAGTGKVVLPLVAARIAGLDWEAALTALGAVRPVVPEPRLDVVASLEGRRNYNRFAVESAVGGALARRLRGSHLARTSAGRQPGEPDLTVRVFIRGTRATAALAVSARPLHRRGYKQDAGPGTLHPPVAAALARIAGPAAGETVADPFCGDGTIAIETALSCPRTRVLAGDIDPDRLGNTRRNAARAGVRLTVCRLDAGRLPWPDHGVDAVLANPPWNIAVDSRGLLQQSLDGFWPQLRRVLAPGGRLCVIADAELDAPRRLRALGCECGLQTQIRLAGRVSHVLLCAPPGDGRPELAPGLAAWRLRAIAEGVVTDAGF